MVNQLLSQEIISRQYAIAENLRHYFTGKPCKYGHISKRYVSTNKCVDCNYLSGKEWKKDNIERSRYLSRESKKRAGKEKSAAWKKSWDERNKEHKRAYKAKWYKNNKEHCLNYTKEKKKNNRLFYTALENKRRALKKGVSTSLDYTKEDVLFLLKIQKNLCLYCKEKLVKYHIDHIVPIKLGGDNSKLNIQILCPTCNMRKNAKHPIKFAQENGLLL